jgi:hypothetical protein
MIWPLTYAPIDNFFIFFEDYMPAILDAFQSAQLSFDNIAHRNDKEGQRRDVFYSARSNFLGHLRKALALLSRQKTETINGSVRTALDLQVNYLARITSIFLARMPIRDWVGEVHTLKGIFQHKLFSADQSKTLKDAFEQALTRDITNRPQDAEYFFVNHHHFNDAENIVSIFSNVLVNNLPGIFKKNMNLGLQYAVIMAGHTPSDETKRTLTNLITEHASKFNDAYQPEDEVRCDPLLLFALWERKGPYKDVAIKVLEERVDRLALAGKSHARHEYGGPGVLVIPTEGDDLHFDAYDAIRDMVNSARDDSHLPILQSARRLFAKHFDSLTELHPSKALKFAIKLHSDLYHRYEEGGALEKEALGFGNDIIGMVAANLVERIGHITYELDSLDVADFIMRNTNSEGTKNLAIEAAIRRFQAASGGKRGEQLDTLLGVAEQIGERHPQFRTIVNLVIGYESSVSGAHTDKAIQDCLNLAPLISGRGNLRFSVLRCAKTLAELQTDSDPLGAEKNLQKISELCATKREKTLIADDIARRIMPGAIQVRPLTTGDRALMDNLLAKYG